MSNAVDLRDRASHYRAAAEGADQATRKELLRIASDFDDEAAMLDALPVDHDERA